MVHVFPLFEMLADESAPPRQAFVHMADFMDRVLGPLRTPHIFYPGVIEKAGKCLYHAIPNVILHHPCLVIPALLFVVGVLAALGYLGYWIIDDVL